MVDHIITKPLGLVLIATHMFLNVSSQAEVTGILGSNITLKFKFNVSFTENIHFAVYTTGQKKIAEYSKGKEGGVFNIHPRHASVFWHITNLKQNDSGSYWASLFIDSGPPEESNKVQLRVREENRTSTVSPVQTDIPITEDSGSSSLVTVLVVSPVILLAAVLPCLIWCLVRTKGKQQQAPQQSSNPTVQETVKVSSTVPAASLVYSVLDFPKRSSTVLEINPSDTEYAAVSYLPESRRV